jgi:hypothetical protein
MPQVLFHNLRRLTQVRLHTPTRLFASFARWQTMDPKTRQLYLADAPPNVVKLEIKPHFEALTEKQKHYAHHISRSVNESASAFLLQILLNFQHAHSFAGPLSSVPVLHCVKFPPNQNRYTIWLSPFTTHAKETGKPGLRRQTHPNKT